MKANNIFPEIFKNSPHLLHIHFHTWMHFLKKKKKENLEFFEY